MRMSETIRRVVHRVKEDRDSYPVTNIRWTWGVILFVLPLVGTALMEGWSVGGTVGAGLLGVGVLLLFSVLSYGIEFHEERTGARVILAVTLAAILTALIGFT
jgi:hypothetical protein